MTEIAFDGVGHRYGQRVVLDGIELRLTEQRIGIVGANGSGKSTLARMINGLVEPTSGRVTVDGLDVVKQGKQVRQRVGFVFTDPDNQIVMPTVAEDVAFSLRKSGLSRAEIGSRVQRIAGAVRVGGSRRPSHPPAVRRAEAAAGAGGRVDPPARGDRRRRTDDAARSAELPAGR